MGERCYDEYGGISYLYSPDKKISNQLLDQGLLPHQGLGINSQGPLQPLIPAVKNDRKGIECF